MGARIRHARVETAFGSLWCATTDVGLCLLALDAEGGSRALEAWIARHEPGAVSVEDPRALAEAARQLVAYGARELRKFDLPLDPRGSEFELAVWRSLAALRCGETTTYGELAAGLGQPGAAQAVGAAAGRNPLPVVIPCHRLLARAGLGGFSGGLDMKRRLLTLEGVAVQTKFR